MPNMPRFETGNVASRSSSAVTPRRAAGGISSREGPAISHTDFRAEGERDRAHDQVVERRQRLAAELAKVVAQPRRALHVDFDLEREVRDLAPRRAHSPGDRALRRSQLDGGLLALSGHDWP